MTQTMYFCRASRANSDDLLLRTPELRSLREATIAIFGVGCLGATSSLEFARAGIGVLRLLDHDTFDPGTGVRWPFGLSATGRLKVDVLYDFIASNYPSTGVVTVPHNLGAVRGSGDGRTDREAVDEMIDGASLIYDSSAEVGVQHYLSEAARVRGIPYICISGTYGGWGGKIIRIVPGRSRGCWMCSREAFDDGTLVDPPCDLNGEVQPRGCGDVTFTGAGFDMAQIALAGVRATVSTLCAGLDGAYPASDWDVMTVAFRDNSGQLIAPRFEQFTLEKHRRCGVCVL